MRAHSLGRQAPRGETLLCLVLNTFEYLDVIQGKQTRLQLRECKEPPVEM